jgi:hypothetical protein
MAKLYRVTFTGVDEHTDLDRVNEISQRFPFVEWGILLSASRTGKEQRYPGLACIGKTGAIARNVAVHLCGGLASAAARSEGDAFRWVRDRCLGVGRIQLNISNNVSVLQPDLVTYDADRVGLEVICQTREFNCPGDVRPPIFLLHDTSGGRGIYAPFPAPPLSRQSPDIPIGFAGGIGPDNIGEVLAEIAAMDIPNPVWIDMEGKVRTEDWFDLAKVEAVLEAAAPYVTGDFTA